MLTRVQLNLLGRRSYLSSVISLATGTGSSTISLENNDDDNPEQGCGSDFDTNRKYLTFSWWLLNRGWADIRDRVEAAVREVFGHLSPRDLLSHDTFSQLTIEVRKKVEGGDDQGNKGSKWLSYLLPPAELEEHVLRESGVLKDSATAETRTGASTPSTPSTTAPLRRMLDETSDLIESPAFSHVLTLILDAGFSVLLNNKVLDGAFDLTTSIPELEEEQAAKVVLLPKILSVLTRQAHSIGHGMPNEYLSAMEQVRDLEAFAAVVYSSNWENEIKDDGYVNVPTPVATTSTSAAASVAPQESGPGIKQSQDSTETGIGESVVMVDRDPATQISFESAWEKASEK